MKQVLMCACSEGYVNIVEKLIEAGADINGKRALGSYDDEIDATVDKIRKKHKDIEKEISSRKSEIGKRDNGFVRKVD